MCRRDQSRIANRGSFIFIPCSHLGVAMHCLHYSPTLRVSYLDELFVEAPVVNRHVVFSHGQESGPWGRKISALAEVARSEGYETHSVDYRGIDEPRARIAKLVDFCKELSGDLVLVGSSMGGYVAVASASLLHARGVFLMAPALYMEGLPELRGACSIARRPSCTAGATKSCPLSTASASRRATGGAASARRRPSPAQSDSRDPLPVRILPDCARPAGHRL